MRDAPIPVEQRFARWREDPDYRAARAALEPEYELASALIGARGRAGLSQGEVARRMGSSQPSVARLESGRANPSVDTLRRYAAATSARLRLVFEPDGA